MTEEVIELAKTDVTAETILDSAVDELVLSISSALQNVGFQFDESRGISWVGSVAQNPIVSERLRDELKKRWPKAEIVQTSLAPIDGVELIAQIDKDSPIYSKVTRVQTQ